MAAVIGELLRWVSGRRRRVVVKGESMQPTLGAGEFVLVNPRAVPRDGDIVVVIHPEQPDLMLIKRALTVHADGVVTVLSDNELVGTDSRVFGPVPAANVEGVVRLSLSRLTML